MIIKTIKNISVYLKCNYLSHLFNGTTLKVINDLYLYLGLRTNKSAAIHGAIQNQNPPYMYVLV